MKIRHFFWYWTSWYPMLICLVLINSHPPVGKIQAGDIGLFVGIVQMLGMAVYFGGLKLHEYVEEQWNRASKS